MNSSPPDLPTEPKTSVPVPDLRRRNQTLPIAKLPPELLLEVFFNLLAPYDPMLSALTQMNTPSWNFGVVLKWRLGITHVCHHWRQVTLSCAQLWTVIHFGRYRAEVIQLFLERNGSLPLAVRCSLDRKGHQDLDARLSFMQAHRRRIRHLRITGKTKLLNAVLNSGELRECGLRLETLSVVHYSRSQPFMVLPDTPEFLAYGMNPEITSLSLTSCALRWDSPLLSPKLTTLELLRPHNSPSPSLPELYSVLEKLPLLTRLAVDHDFTEIPQSQPPLTLLLPNLRELHFASSQSSCILFLETIYLPRLVQLSIDCRESTYPTQMTESAVLSLAAAHLSLIHQSSNLEFRFRQSVPSTQRLQIGDGTGRVLSIQLFQVSDDYYITLGQLMDLTSRSLVKQLATAHATFLELQGYPYTYSATDLEAIGVSYDWNSLFSYECLSTLRLKTHRPLLLFEVLFERAMLCIGFARQPSIQHIGLDGLATQLLPKLDTIEFIDFDFHHRPQNESMLVTEIPVHDLLFAFLWAVERHPYSTPPSIVIKRCMGVQRRWLYELGRLAKVDWDGSGSAEEDAMYPLQISAEDTFLALDAWFETIGKCQFGSG